MLRKSAEAIRLAHLKVRRDAARKGNQVQPATLRFAEYVIVFTTFPEPPFSAADVLEWYRLRWQVELVFKRFKSLAQLGHVPKYDDDSASVALRETVRGAAGGEADPPRPRDFPLGLRRAGAGAPRARGVTSSSCSTSHARHRTAAPAGAHDQRLANDLRRAGGAATSPTAATLRVLRLN